MKINLTKTLALICALVFENKIESELFVGNAPLASFSSRIKLGFYIGKLSKAEKTFPNCLK